MVIAFVNVKQPNSRKKLLFTEERKSVTHMTYKLLLSPLTVGGQNTRLIFKTTHVVAGHTTTAYEKQAEYPEITCPEDKALPCILSIIDRIIADDCSIYFLRAVDPEIDNAINYYEIIKNPIDLSLIRKKALSRKYLNFSELVADIKLLINNATQFNPLDHFVHQAALKMSYLLCDLLNLLNKNPQELEKDAHSSIADQKIAKLQSKYMNTKRDRERAKKASEAPKKVVQKLIRKLNTRDYEQLAKDIRELSSPALFGVIEILQKGEFRPEKLPIDLDLQSLPEDTADDLRVYVDSCKEDSAKKPAMYAWQPYEPKTLKDIQTKYAQEMQIWKLPPKEMEINRENTFETEI